MISQKPETLIAVCVGASLSEAGAISSVNVSKIPL